MAGQERGPATLQYVLETSEATEWHWPPCPGLKVSYQFVVAFPYNYDHVLYLFFSRLDHGRLRV